VILGGLKLDNSFRIGGLAPPQSNSISLSKTNTKSICASNDTNELQMVHNREEQNDRVKQLMKMGIHEVKIICQQNRLTYCMNCDFLRTMIFSNLAFFISWK
jgi:hypothetical protein